MFPPLLPMLLSAYMNPPTEEVNQVHSPQTSDSPFGETLLYRPASDWQSEIRVFIQHDVISRMYLSNDMILLLIDVQTFPLNKIELRRTKNYLKFKAPDFTRMFEVPKSYNIAQTRAIVKDNSVLAVKIPSKKQYNLLKQTLPDKPRKNDYEKVNSDNDNSYNVLRIKNDKNEKYDLDETAYTEGIGDENDVNDTNHLNNRDLPDEKNAKDSKDNSKFNDIL